MLTQPGDLVLDVFAGSNTTGQVAKLRAAAGWRSSCHAGTLAASAFRFLSDENTHHDTIELHRRILAGEAVDLDDYLPAADPPDSCQLADDNRQRNGPAMTTRRAFFTVLARPPCINDAKQMRR